MPAHKWDPVCKPATGLIRPVRIDPTGETGPTRGQARGRWWRSTSPGYVVPIDAPDVPEQRILEQSVRLPAAGAVTGWAACRLHGGNFFDGLEPDGRTLMPVPVAVGRKGNVRKSTGIMVSRDRLDQVEVVIRQGVRVVVPVRAVFDAARFAPDVREAIVVLDMAMAAELTSVQRVRTYAVSRPRAAGVHQVISACELASEHSRSPNEVRTRLVCEVDAGLPRLLVNCAIHDLQGVLLGVADLLDLRAGLVIEFDGEDHRGRTRHTRDVAKDEALRGVGLEVTRITGTDLRDRGLVVRRVTAARSRAVGRAAASGQRRWTPRPRADGLEQRLLEREALVDLLSLNASAAGP